MMANKPQPALMMRFLQRRIRQIFALAVLVAVIAWWVARLDDSLSRTPYFTGWLLFGLVVALVAFGLRKRLTFLPFAGSARAWMQIHIYTGFLSVIVFSFHIGLKVPDGQFELLLAVMFLGVSLSGFYGLYITRAVPKKLTAVENEVVYESIPSARRQLQLRADQITIECAKQSPALADFYLQRLAIFFAAKRNLLYYIAPNGRLKRSLIRELASVDRYLPASNRKPSEDLKRLIAERDDLDFHSAMQGRLKLWLFIHLATTYGLLVMIGLHIVLVQAFHGG